MFGSRTDCTLTQTELSIGPNYQSGPNNGSTPRYIGSGLSGNCLIRGPSTSLPKPMLCQIGCNPKYIFQNHNDYFEMMFVHIYFKIIIMTSMKLGDMDIINENDKLQ